MNIENPFDALVVAVHEARAIDRAIDRQAESLAELLDGRLKGVSSWRLKKLKKQLANFNMHTGRWSNKQ